jgi:lysophospholipase L1-like esterase
VNARGGTLGERRRIAALTRSIGAIAILLCVLADVAGSASAAAPKFNPPKSYYLALGDSFSFGYQVTRLGDPPDPAVFDHGFVDRFGVYLRSIEPTIATVNYGCPGESTLSFIQGGCPATAQGFPLHDSFEGTQLDAAVAFLEAHPGEVSPITISLVLNDVQRFIADCAFDPLCIRHGAPATTLQVTANLARILKELRRAAPNIEIIVLGPYDPFIGNLEFADSLFMALNDAMAKTIASASARYADIFPTFNPQGDMEAETRAMCMLTLSCTNGDGHPSDLGYQVMADTIIDVSGYRRLLDGDSQWIFGVRLL